MGSLGQFVIAAEQVSSHPDSGGLPGSPQLNDLVNGLMFWVLLGCLAGLLIAAGIWALASHTNNYQQSGVAKKGVLLCAGAALVVGAAPAIIQFFQTTGEQVKGSASQVSDQGGGGGGAQPKAPAKKAPAKKQGK